jgi:PIN domain nuclease of toxin-antitoxin system
MGRRVNSLIYLDTHVAVWLYDALLDRLSATAIGAIEECELLVSPIVKLELQFLNEIGRLRARPDAILGSLAQTVALRIATSPLEAVVAAAMGFSWTRDVFDRLIVAECVASGEKLLTKDKTIQKNFARAVW